MVDPIASMRCWAITVQLGGRSYDVPALPAVDWWPIIVDPRPTTFLDILSSRDPDDSYDLDTLLLNGDVSAEELDAVFREAIQEVTGRSLHVAFVTATVAADQWPVIGGLLAQSGFRWDVQSIGAALDAIHSVIVSNLEDAPRKKFLAILEDEALTDPSRKGRKRGPSREALDAFESMAGPRPAPAPSPGASTAEPSDSQPPRTQTQPLRRLQGARSGVPRRPPQTPGGSGPQATLGNREGGG